MSERNAEVEKWVGELREAVQRRPRAADACEEYEGVYQHLSDLRRSFQAELARAIEGPLNAKLAGLPQHTLADKQLIAASVNDGLRRLGLCVRCPSTGGPAILIADYRDHPDLTSRFRFHIIGPSGRPLNKDASAKLPLLTIMEDPQRIEHFASKINRQPGPQR